MAKKNSTIGSFISAKKQVEEYKEQIVSEVKELAKEKGGVLLCCLVWGFGLGFIAFSVSFAIRIGFGL